MKSSRAIVPTLAFIAILISLLACNLPGQEGYAPEPVQVTVVYETQVPAPQTTPTNPEPVAEAPSSEAAASPVPTVAHQMWPGEPGGVNTWVSDRSTKSLAASRQSDSDIFDINLLERPYSAQVMDYQAHLDLVRVNLHIGAPWLYVTFVLEGPPPPDSTAIYALEFDLDSDGRGDWLVLGQVPPDSQWTSTGAKAYQDTNNDVGGFRPMESDAPNPAWNGYDQLVFDQGLGGGDPDVVWVRRDPGNPNQVQLAMKYALINNDDEFAFGGWADEGLKNPAGFDYNDFKTLEQAGSPVKASSRYPLKELAMVDNTCRWTYGYTPLEPIPGLCPLPATPTPTPTSTATATATATATEVPPVREVPGCQPPPQGCTNGWWVGEPDCYCSPY